MIYTENFTGVKDFQGISLRGIARDIALNLLTTRNTLLGLEEALKKPRIQFLFIHHVFDDEIEKFERLLKELAKNHTFISHSEAVRRLLLGDIDKPYISWSSDDGFKNNLKAAEILERYGANCCFFLNPVSIGVKDDYWVKEFCSERLRMPPIEFMNWNDVHELQKRGHEIGSHTVNHTNIIDMSSTEVHDDLVECKAILEKKCGPILHFAYPYGRFFDFNKTAFDLVFRVGYDSCSTAERGCHISTSAPIHKNELFIRRDQVIAAWKLGHIMHFIAQSAKKADLRSNFIPDEYT